MKLSVSNPVIPAVRLHIWDTAGGEQFRSLTHIYYKGANVICLVYDSTSEKSFDALNFWVDEIKQRVDMESIQIYVVASKVDNSNAEEVSIIAGNTFAKKIGAQFHQTSAKDGTGVEDLFQSIADRLYLKNVAD